MRPLTNIIVFFFPAFLAIAGTACAVQIRPVERDGRTIQLDGFLLEWKKADARPLAQGSFWYYDVCNTREGLTGYFTTARDPVCGPWTFRFLHHRLSPYVYMELQSRPDSSKPFYKISSTAVDAEKGLAAEWLIPWDSIWHDTTGVYQVGLFAFDTCGDTLQPLIFTGHVYHQKAPMWGGVYVKAIVLGLLMILLFFLQKRARAIVRDRKKRF
jgi:hypothetical protein